MQFLGDKSELREESTQPTQGVASSPGVKGNNSLRVDSSSSPRSYDSHSHPESSTFRASNAPEDRNNTVSKDSSPKSAVCSNKSDLTEISSMRYYASAKNEEQVESSLQGAQATGLVVKPDNDENKRDLAERYSNHKQCSIQSTIVHGGQEKPGVSVQTVAAKDTDRSHDFEVEVTICDICGNLGREELLAVCSKCGEGAEHIYCMHVKLEKVPSNWVCEDCIAAEKDKKQKENENGRRGSLNAMGRELQRENSGSFDPKCGSDFKDEDLALRRDQKHKVGSCFAAERYENGSEFPSANQRIRSRKRKPTLSQDCSVNKFVKPNMTEPGIVSLEVSLPELQKRPFGLFCTGGSANLLLFSTFDKSSVNESIPAFQKCCNEGQNLLRDDNQSNGWPPLGDSPPVDPSWFHTFPLPYCIWQGRFKLQMNQIFSSFYIGIQAYLSRSASHKFLTLTPGFTTEILLKEASGSAIWASLFLNNHATAENIHIYFFAKDSESYENSYRSLLEHMIISDVCLKGSFGGFEMFIFSSNRLKQPFQRWNGLYFLWGVFKDPKPVSFVNTRWHSHSHKDHTGEISRELTLPMTGESLLIEHLQMRGGTFLEQTHPVNTGSHFESAAPNLELSLGLGGEASTRTGHSSKMQAVSSKNIYGHEPSFSLSLSLPQPCLEEDVDTRLSLCCDFGRS